jgi:peroxiredoxin Q/BCP
LQARLDDFRARGAEVVAVSSSLPEAHARAAEKIEAAFPLLSDAEGAAISAYGLLHEDALPFHEGPIARPAVFIIDPGGTLRARYITDNWRVRERAEKLLQALAELTKI